MFRSYIVTKEKVNPVVHAVGRHRKGGGDTSCQGCSGYTEIWALSVREGDVERSRSTS